MHSSLTPLAGGIALLNIVLGEVNLAAWKARALWHVDLRDPDRHSPG
ncbi:MAG: hypothetical protein R2867_34320 [Caldilineaceae bacterium]